MSFHFTVVSYFFHFIMVSLNINIIKENLKFRLLFLKKMGYNDRELTMDRWKIIKIKYNKGATMEKKEVALSLFSGILENSPKAMKVISEEIEEIETKIIKYGHVSENLEVTSMDHISLPFFTRKRNRRVQPPISIFRSWSHYVCQSY